MPEDEPLRTPYEVDEAADNVLRSVEILPDGRITRDGVELEQRNGDDCPSLFDCGWREGIAGASPDKIVRIDAEAFEEQHGKGIDTPFWFVSRHPCRREDTKPFRHAEGLVTKTPLRHDTAA